MKSLVLIAVFACSLAAAADTVRGVVTNGTTRKLSAGDEVSLKRVGNGMEDAGQTTTNARGEFSFDIPGTSQMYIIWVKHQNILYTGRAMPGSGPVAIQVYDSAPEVKEIKIGEHMMMIQANPNQVHVDELYTVDNSSSPPRTKAGQRAFQIYLPEGATLEEAAAQIPDGMPLKAGLAPTGEKGQYAFAYPVRPGPTQFRLSYTLPYTGKLKLSPRIPGPIDSSMIGVPSSIKLVPADRKVYDAAPESPVKNVTIYVGRNLTPGQQLGFEIEGTGVMPRADGNGQRPAAGPAANPGAPGGPAEDNRPGGGLGVPNEKPDPLRSGQWPFLAVLSAFLALGAFLVYFSNRGTSEASIGNQPATPATLLDAMKEEFFQLEADRLQGKISPQEYETSKAALEKTLERALQRQKTNTAPSA